MEKKKAIGFIITAGHLDIEWYQPLDSYRFWTIETFEQLKKAAMRKDFGCYVLDGQVYPLEEYLGAVPEAEEEVRTLIKNKKLAIGPFYTQFDEWLPSTENIIRNCLYGIRKAERFGSCMYAGYLPDNFGHPLQLPQILKGFGIDSLQFMRGLPEIEGGHPDEFLYEGIDKSRVMTSHFRESYSSGAFDIFDRKADPIQPRSMPYYEHYLSFEYHKALSSHDNTKKLAGDLVAKAKSIRSRYPSDVIPLIAGHDHLPPQVRVGETVALANEMQDEIDFVMGDVKEYADLAASRMKEAKIYNMELLGSRYQYVLMGAMTTRAYIKRENFACEALLEHYTEPLLVYASGLGYQPNKRLYDEAWKYMMINSAHDSIHGSSTDEVHVEMMARYQSVKQISAGLCADALSHISKNTKHWWKEGERGLICYSPVRADSQVGEAWIYTDNKPFAIETEDGRQITYQILKRDEIPVNMNGDVELEAYPDAGFTRILIADDYQEDSFRSYRIKEAKAVEKGTCSEESRSKTVHQYEAEQHIKAAKSSYNIENEYLSVSCRENGLIDIYDKQSDRYYRGLNMLEDDADAGDAWDYSPTWQSSEMIFSVCTNVKREVTEFGPLRSTIAVSGSMEVPKRIENGSRSREKTQLPFTFFISLIKGSRRVDVKLIIDNTAEDHRLRLHVPTGIKSSTVLLQSQEAVIERPVRLPDTKEEYFQPQSTLMPFRDWNAVYDGKCGLAVAVKGLFEYEASEDSYTKEVALRYTLFRSIGVMGRLNMKQRKGGASMALPTPGAQCIGKQEIEWSYIPFTCEENDKTPFLSTAQSFLYPPYLYAVRPEQKNGNKMLPESYYTCKETNIVFSALKPSADDDNTDILRLYENQGRAVNAKIEIPNAKKVYRCSLNEKNIEEVPLLESSVIISFGEYEIVTLKVIDKSEV